MKPQRLPQELCQAYLLYQVPQGGIFSTGGHCVEEEGEEEGVAMQAGGTALGKGRTAAAGHRAQCFVVNLWSSGSQTSTGDDGDAAQTSAAGCLLRPLLGA